MSFDGLMLGHVIKDLKKHILNNRITKIYQLSSNDLLFQTRGVNNHTFLMSSSAQHTRMHRTNNAYDKPMHPPMFCMFLRKHLEGAEIKDITQHGNDRIATFTLKGRNEMGDITHKYLIFEALGKDANIIVTNEDYKILEALKHTGPFEEGLRTLTPSATYSYPEDARINPYDETRRNAFLTEHKTDNIKDYLKAFSGISPQFVKEYLHRLKENHAPIETFDNLLNEANYQYIDAKVQAYAFYQLTHLSGTKTHKETIQELFDAYFFERDRLDKLKQSAKDIQALIKRHIEKSKDKREKLQKDMQKTANLEAIRVKGELIQAYRNDIQKGDRLLTCTNYYTGETIEIALDPKKSVTENSEAYYKKYKKIKASVPHITREIEKAHEELDYFLVLETQLEFADLNDLEEIREELEAAGYLKKRTRKGKNKRKQSFTIYHDSEGTQIYVGKNNQQNSHITHTASQHFHVWFHVKDAPGSHVVVTEGFPLSETTIRTAANLASYFSKMRHSSSVPVDYTEIRHVKKIPGKHPSFVRYTHQKTIYIDPDEDSIKALKKSRN